MIKLLCGFGLSLLTAWPLSAQDVVITGVVEDQYGNYLPNAYVSVGDKTDTTDLKGRFEMKAPRGMWLTVTKNGFEKKLIKSGKSVLVVLKPLYSEANIDLLYQKRKSVKVTSSVSTVDNRAISNNSVLTFGNALYGKLAGLNLKQSDGEPGDDYPGLLIRGRHTFTGSNTPLVLVDGFERDYNTLSVEEVESVSVLKDAAATALYGMDGANGVMLVTTKRGVDGRATVGFKMEYGVKTPTRLADFYGSYDYARFYNMAQINDKMASTGGTFDYFNADCTGYYSGGALTKPSYVLYNDTKMLGYKLNQDPMLYPNVDWIDETIRKYSPTKKYYLDFRGGNQIAKYFVNVGLAQDEGIFRNADHGSYSTNRNLDRINFRSNVDINLSKKLSIRIDLSGRLENINQPTVSTASFFNNVYTFHPNVAPVYVAPGVYGGTNLYRNNPVAYLNDQGYKETHRRYFQSNIFARYDLSTLTKGLAAGVRATFDNSYSVTDGYTKTYGVKEVLSAYSTTPVTYKLSDLYGLNSNLASTGPDNESELRSNNLEFYMDYNRVFGKHDVGAMIMYHQDEYITSTEFPNRRLTASGSLSYNYDSKYYVDFATQYGATENFKKGSRFGFFPALSGAWVASNEAFLKGNPIVSYLKLRASTGLVGNQNIGGTRFGYRMLYNSNGTEMAIGNPYLTWEKSYKTDFGVDVSLLKDIHLSSTLFYEFRDDILNSGDALIPEFFGNSFGHTNYGQVKSQGAEFSVLYEKQYKNWGFNLGANATYVENEILRKREVYREWDYLYAQGKPISQRMGLIALGLFQSQKEIDESPSQSALGKAIPGSIRYKDVNGDKVINSDDYTAIGKDGTVPDWNIGLTFGANYRGFYFDAQLQAAVGRDVYLRDAMYSLTPLFGDKGVSTYIKNPWTPETAQSADFPSLTIENAAQNYNPTSTYWLRNGDFLRMRNLEVGYKFSYKLISKIGLSSANLYVRGVNLFTLDHIGFFDPEVIEGYPVMKSYNVGINLKF